MGKKYINFNFENSKIHVLEKTDGYKNDVLYTSLDIEDGEKKSLTARKLKHTIGLSKMKSKSARIIIPESALIIRRLLIPKFILDIRDYIEEHHITQLDTFMDNPIYDYVIQKDHIDEQVVILFAISNQNISYYTDLVHATGRSIEQTLTVYEVLYELYRVYTKREQVTSNLIIRLEENNLFMVIYENGVPVFSQNKELVSTSKEELLVELKDKLGLIDNYYAKRLNTERVPFEEIFVVDNNNLDTSDWEAIITNKPYVIYDFNKHHEDMSYDIPKEQLFNFIISQGGGNNE